MRWCPKCEARFRGDMAACPIDGTALTRPADPFIGRTIAGRYLIQEALGSGGMGTVYRARHKVIGRDVALKFLDPKLTSNERQRKRFLGEARAANQINHEHIIDIFDFGETDDGIVYMVMEYLEGRSLWHEIGDGPMEARRALRIALQAALGLARAHQLGVVHRDVKPANIFLAHRRMDRDFVKVLDFGVARIEHDARITGQNVIVGTPEYIAPEQIRSSGALPASDLYSLGCVMYEMLTGRLPFTGKTTMLLVQHLNDSPPAPSSLIATIPNSVDRLVLKLMSKKVEQRYRDGYHLVEDIQRLLDHLPPEGVVGASSSPPSPETTNAVRGQGEEDGWERTATLCRELLQEVGGAKDVPGWLPQAIDQVEGLVEEVRHLRGQLGGVAAKATAQEEAARKPREQIGHALDELAQDDSRLVRQLEALQEELAQAEARLDAAVHVVSACTAAGPLGLVEGTVVSAEQATLLGDLAHAASALEEARASLSLLRSKRQAKQLEQQDLRYQIEQLKQKLGALYAVSTCDMELSHEEVNRIDALIQSKLEAIVPAAERVSSYFHSRVPGLRERLARKQKGFNPDAETLH